MQFINKGKFDEQTEKTIRKCLLLIKTALDRDACEE